MALEIDPPQAPALSSEPALAHEMVSNWEAAPPVVRPTPSAINMGTAVPAMAMATSKAATRVAAPTKPQAWGGLEAPPVWGHGAKGDTIHKPEVSEHAEKA